MSRAISPSNTDENVATQTPLSLGRRVAYSAFVTLLFFAGVTSLLWWLESRGAVSTFRQDDTILYLQGDFLRVSEVDGAPVYEVRDAQAPEVVQAIFPAQKAPGVFRIFVTGGSFVRGGHHIPPGSPPVGYGTITDWLAILLKERLPGTQFEVINAGANGQGSVRVAAVVAELTHADPDLILVITGNNEGQGNPPAYNQALNDWILYRAMKKVLKEEPRPEARPDHIIQTANQRAVHTALGINLDRMVEVTRAGEVPIAFATLPINLLGLYEAVRPEEWDQAAQAHPSCAAMVEEEEAGRCEAAIDAATRCPAQLLSLLTIASCHRAQGHGEEARVYLEAAVQQEPRGRARPSYNALVRQSAEAIGAPLVDLEATFRARSRDGLTGDRFFIDAVHMSCMGYLPVARDLFEGLVRGGALPVATGEPLPDPTTDALRARYGWAEPPGVGGRPPPIDPRRCGLSQPAD